jgi:lipopolysaccharide transport system ATP-binding protein
MGAIQQLCKSCILIENGALKLVSKDTYSVIKKYLFQYEDNMQKSEWLNVINEFDNQWFKPLRFAITDENGKNISMPVSNNSNFWFTVEGEIKEMENALTIGYAIYDENNQHLYSSCHVDVKEEAWVKTHKGLNILKTQIPKRFLNEGTYKIDLVLALYNRGWLCEPNVKSPSVFLTIRGGISDSPYWFDKRAGVMAPVIEWEQLL